MKNFFKNIAQDSVLQWSFWITIFLIILMIGGIALSYTNIPPVVPLYNNMPWGYARLGKTYELFFLPLLTLIICVVNTSIGIRLRVKIPLLARFLFLTMGTLAFFTSFFLARLILLTV